jgi:hypothetical protein
VPLGPTENTLPRAAESKPLRLKLPSASYSNKFLFTEINVAPSIPAKVLFG